MAAGAILLLAAPHSYRLAAFKQAASSVDADVLIGLDTAPGFRPSDPSIVPLRFADSGAAVQSITDRLNGRALVAVISVDDGATELAQHVSEAFSLRRNGAGSEIAGRDKFVMRSHFAEAGLPTPDHAALSPADDPGPVAAAIGFPVVIKPTRLNGSRGVIRADSPDEVITAFSRTCAILHAEGFADNEPCLIIERFIPGQEVAVEAVMTDGSLTVLALFDKPDPLDGPFFEESIYVTPSRLPESIQSGIQEMARAMAHAVGIRHGPVHAELRINDAGIWPIEIAARSIGGMCSTVFEFSAGLSLEEVIVRNAVGTLDLDGPGPARAAGVMMIPIPGSGMLRAVHGIEAALAVPGITGVDITAPLNAPIVALPEGSSYLGFIFATGGRPDEVEAALRAAHSRLRIDIDPLLPLRPV
jgi:biotin carboxylase